jgi:hypothetical protein
MNGLKVYSTIPSLLIEIQNIFNYSLNNKISLILLIDDHLEMLKRVQVTILDRYMPFTRNAIQSFNKSQ